MKILTHVIGNVHSPEWRQIVNQGAIEIIYVDQWTAQKSRFIIKTGDGEEWAVALKRNHHISDGDILYYSPEERRAIVIRLNLSQVLVIDLSRLITCNSEHIIRVAVEVGHAIGNQHWAAVVKDSKVYVPLTVDSKVMMSVMNTHNFEGISYSFQPGHEVIPYLAPHEIRRLFGSTGH